METSLSDVFHDVASWNIHIHNSTKGSRHSHAAQVNSYQEKMGGRTDRERGVEEGEFVERLWRSGDLVEAYPLVGDLVDA